jgi:hypothetical protein
VYKVKTYYYLLIVLTLISCSKEINEPAPLITESSIETFGLNRDLDSTVLSATLLPVVTCYAYDQGETPKPCDIFVTVTCHLSRPITKRLYIEMIKVNETGWDKKGIDAETDSSTMILDIAPGIQEITFTTIFSNPDNLHVAGLFTFGKIIAYDRLH